MFRPSRCRLPSSEAELPVVISPLVADQVPYRCGPLRYPGGFGSRGSRARADGSQLGVLPQSDLFSDKLDGHDPWALRVLGLHAIRHRAADTDHFKHCGIGTLHINPIHAYTLRVVSRREDLKQQIARR